MFNELEDLNKLNSIEEITNFVNNNMEDLEKLGLNERQQLVDTFLDKTMYKIQTECLNTEFGKAVNAGLDIGLRIILPDYLSEGIIELKNNLMEYGIKDGVEKTFNDTLDLGKNAVNILTNNFESISDAKSAIKAGGALEKISDLIDKGIDALKDNKKIDNKTAKTIKKEKNTIIKNIEENIDKSFEEQISNFEKLEKYISNWKEAYNSQDFKSMEKEYKKMEKIMTNLMPMENSIKDFRTIQNIQDYLNNNGKSFDFSEDVIELANKLIN